MSSIPSSRAIRREYSMKFGTQILPRGVRFRLWAPKCQDIKVHILDIDRFFPMEPKPRGWFEASVAEAMPGMRYRFILPDGRVVPDPASRYLPHDVDGPSEIIDPLAFEWTDRGWVGRPWEETILYEIHVGTFTREGTFLAAIAKLDHLVELGVNTIQLMPLADFHGRWNWGYDGANLFAPDASYGRPEDFKALVNAAHEKGISVMLDVIYNHFGPKGNHLAAYTPLTKETIRTPWGDALNFDGEDAAMVRDLIFTNARYWLAEYHLDGLRLDAVHEIYDDGPRHLLMELAEQARAATEGRHVHLVLENSMNGAGWLKRRETGAPWLYDAQWSDDIHHSIHATATGEVGSYYADFIGRIDLVGRSLAEGMAWQGEYLEHEERHKGEPSAFLPATAFVSYMQNHDQIGNRPWGDRLSGSLPDEALRAWSAIVLLSPQIPLIFMGEEWAASTPFLFFSDVGEELADVIRHSRQTELKNFPEAQKGHLPDPMSRDAFEQSKLNWDEVDLARHRSFLEHYRKLVALRNQVIVPRLHGMPGNGGRFEVLAEKAVRVYWNFGDGSTLELLANLGPEPVDGINVWADGHLWIEGSADSETLGGWTAVFRLKDGDGEDQA